MLRRATVTAPVATDIARAQGAWGGTWGDDGRIVYVPNFPSGLWRVPADGGVPEQLTKPDGADAGYSHVFPQHVPGTADVLFGYWGRTFYTALLSPATRTWREITQSQNTQALFVGTYAASGHVLAGDVAAGVRAAAWTPSTTTTVTPQAAVLDDVYWELSVERPWLNVSEKGTAVYVPGDPSSRRLVWVDRQGRSTPVPGDPDQILRATVSRDGRRIAYDGNRSTPVVSAMGPLPSARRRPGSGEPAEHDLDARRGAVGARLLNEEEPAAIERDVVGRTAVARNPVAPREQHARLPGHEVGRSADAHRDQLVGVPVEQLAFVARPQRLGAAAGGHRLARVRSGERPDIDFLNPGRARHIGEPLAVRRDAPTDFTCRRLDQRLRRGVGAGQAKRPDIGFAPRGRPLFVEHQPLSVWRNGRRRLGHVFLGRQARFVAGAVSRLPENIA